MSTQTRIVDKQARIIEQCARGRFVRNVASVNFSFATSRSGHLPGDGAIISADVIVNESGLRKVLLVPPCDGKIESITVAGIPYLPVFSSGGEIRLKIYRNGNSLISTSGASTTDGMTIGGHDISGHKFTLSGKYVNLNSGLSYNATWRSGASQTFTIGEPIYAQVYMSNTLLKSGNPVSVVNVNAEWIPTDRTYASP